MRQRQASPLAVEKTSQFLNALKLFCQGESIFKTINEIHVYYHVNKSTGAACKALEIIKKSDNGYVWLANEPTRQMALMVLNYHLERAPNTMKAESFPQFSDLITQIAELTKKMDVYVSENKDALEAIKIGLQPTVDFIDIEQVNKQQYFELVKAIATGIYSNSDIEVTRYGAVNTYVIDAAKDLMDKAFQ